MSDPSGKTLLTKWKNEIQEAERNRNVDVMSMDYMRNQIVKRKSRDSHIATADTFSSTHSARN